MTEAKGENSLVEMAKRGEYTLVDPLDYVLLGFLPEEGQLALGLYPLGETVLGVKKKLTLEQQKGLSSSTIGSRLRVLRDQGLTVDVHAGIRAGGKRVWQRSKTGTQVLNRWKGANGGGGHA